MNMESARGIVARCWGDPRVRSTVMDTVLAEVFAEKLMNLVNASDALYMAGRWVLEDDRIDTTDKEQAELWEAIRDALGLDTAAVSRGETVSMTRYSQNGCCFRSTVKA